MDRPVQYRLNIEQQQQQESTMTAFAVGGGHGITRKDKRGVTGGTSEVDTIRGEGHHRGIHNESGWIWRQGRHNQPDQQEQQKWRRHGQEEEHSRHEWQQQKKLKMVTFTSYDWWYYYQDDDVIIRHEERQQPLTRNFHRPQKRQFKSCPEKQDTELKHLGEEAKRQQKQLNQLQAQQETVQLMIENLQQLIEVASPITDNNVNVGDPSARDMITISNGNEIANKLIASMHDTHNQATIHSTRWSKEHVQHDTSLKNTLAQPRDKTIPFSRTSHPSQCTPIHRKAWLHNDSDPILITLHTGASMSSHLPSSISELFPAHGTCPVPVELA